VLALHVERKRVLFRAAAELWTIRPVNTENVVQLGVRLHTPRHHRHLPNAVQNLIRRIPRQLVAPDAQDPRLGVGGHIVSELLRSHRLLWRTETDQG